MLYCRYGNMTSGKFAKFLIVCGFFKGFKTISTTRKIIYQYLEVSYTKNTRREKTFKNFFIVYTYGQSSLLKIYNIDTIDIFTVQQLCNH